MMFLRLLTVVALVFALNPVSAAAQAERDGFFIGFGAGVGSLGIEDVDDRETGFSGYFKLGGALNDNVLLGAETNGWTKTESEGGAEGTVTSGSLSAVAYVYPSPTSGFFLKGGVGLARIEVEASGFGQFFSDSETGTAFTLGAGYDVGFGGRFALTPFGNFIYSNYDGGSTTLLQAGLGVNWY